jgi:hypothetical protein
VLPCGGPNRRILKYSYADDFDFAARDRVPLRRRLAPEEVADRAWSPDRNSFIVQCEGAWRAVSFHAEIAVPDELRVEMGIMYDFHAGHPFSELISNVDRLSLYASRELAEGDSAAVLLRVTPERTGRPTVAAVTSVAVAALLWLGVRSGLDSEEPGSRGVHAAGRRRAVLGFSAVQGEHRLVRRAFAASRRWLAVVTFAALAASASLAMEYPSKHPVDTWRICALLCTVAAVRLAWSAIRAPS